MRLPMEKMWPFETDIRIPLMIRGPRIAPNSCALPSHSHPPSLPSLPPALSFIPSLLYSCTPVPPALPHCAVRPVSDVGPPRCSRTSTAILRALTAIIRTLTAIFRTLTAIIRTLTAIIRTLTAIICTLTAIIRALAAIISTSAAMAMNLDLAPTFLELAGVPIPPTYDGTCALDGVLTPYSMGYSMGYAGEGCSGGTHRVLKRAQRVPNGHSAGLSLAAAFGREVAAASPRRPGAARRPGAGRLAHAHSDLVRRRLRARLGRRAFRMPASPWSTP